MSHENSTTVPTSPNLQVAYSRRAEPQNQDGKDMLADDFEQVGYQQENPGLRGQGQGDRRCVDPDHAGGTDGGF